MNLSHKCIMLDDKISLLFILCTSSEYTISRSAIVYLNMRVIMKYNSFNEYCPRIKQQRVSIPILNHEKNQVNGHSDFALKSAQFYGESPISCANPGFFYLFQTVNIVRKHSFQEKAIYLVDVMLYKLLGLTIEGLMLMPDNSANIQVQYFSKQKIIPRRNLISKI